MVKFSLLNMSLCIENSFKKCNKATRSKSFKKALGNNVNMLNSAVILGTRNKQLKNKVSMGVTMHIFNIST